MSRGYNERQARVCYTGVENSEGISGLDKRWDSVLMCLGIQRSTEIQSMKNDSIKYLLESCIDLFKDLSEVNAKDFEDTADPYFNGKANAYDIARNHIESIVKVFFIDVE